MDSIKNHRCKVVYRDGDKVKAVTGLVIEDEIHMIAVRFDDGVVKAIGKPIIISITVAEGVDNHHG